MTLRLTIRTLALATLAVSSTHASADDFVWTLDAVASSVNTTITATTPVGTASDTKASNLSGTIGGSLFLPAYDFAQIDLTTSDVSYTSNPKFTLSYGFFGTIVINGSGLGFAIPGPDNLGFPGPGPVAVDNAGNFTQNGNGAEGRGTLSYSGTGLAGAAAGSGTINLKDVSPLAIDFAGTIVQVGNVLRLTVPINFDETVTENGIPVRTQIIGSAIANTTTTANGWKVDADGSFTTASNYIATTAAPGVASSAFDTAVFGAVISADRTVTVASAVAPRRIVVDTGSATRMYTFSGAGPIQLTGNAGGTPTIQVPIGAARFDVPVQFTSAATVSVGQTSVGDGSVRFANLASSNGSPLVKRGPGVMRVVKLDVGDVTVNSGGIANVAAASSVSKVKSLAILSGSYFDVADGALLVDNGSTPTLSLTSGIVGNIKLAADAGFPLGGITSSSAAGTTDHGVGYGTRATTGLTTINGVAVSNTAIIVRYTRFGDANLDRAVNFDDLLALAQHYNAPGLWTDGDFNYDGTVGFDDLLRLAQNYNLGALTDDQQSIVGSSFAADYALAQSLVPEPTTAMALALLGFSRRRRKCC